MVSPVSEERRLDIIEREVPLSGFTTWNVGGPARYFCEPESLEQLRQAMTFADEFELETEFLGNGSNLLVPDEGFDGLAVRLGPSFGNVENDGNLIKASAGTPLYKLADVANKAGSSCFNFLTGIPGTVGGGLVMNAGAFGSEISDYLANLTYLDPPGEVHEVSQEDIRYNYRSSPFQGTSDKIILEAEFELNQDESQPDMSEILELRREKFPYSNPSAGSVFKNPTEAEMTAGQLLDEVGAKGFSVGDAAVSHQHANFILNKGHATAKNIQKAIDILRDRVYKEFGVTLVTEIVVI
ncbi:MAG: UDP-N-acetylmuramate dehydrogenase [Candidatus Bipolaricaulota bacterium]|nr:UDP-N-acetylmuramate dehydrogenase [Candidatus Bipolaricaulota bacterium]MBS3791691.1 UDP-N-acetylmuramate dehydrogenase [Candidatus Bipolaricaulota bacterium]